MIIDKKSLEPFLLFNTPIKYNDSITLTPITMSDILSFQLYQWSLMVRKDSIFREIDILRMDYWDFLKYSCGNEELAKQYAMPMLPNYWMFANNLLCLACKDAKVEQYNTLDISINGCMITNEIFDDLRKIIIIQNDIDFDIDEFINIDTVKALEKAKEFEAKKNKEKAELEDYIESLMVAMSVTKDYVKSLTIRDFWRLIKRIQRHEYHNAAQTGMMSGMVTFKEPIRNWMSSMDEVDKDAQYKVDEGEVKGKIN